MLMEQPGTQSREEKGYTSTTPLEHGLSYRRVSRDDPNFESILAHSWDYIETGLIRGGSKFVTTEYLIKKAMDGDSDLWVSENTTGKLKGGLLIGDATYPLARGIIAESIGGEFDFSVLVPMLEKHYKSCGYEFFEMTGRKGWERKMKTLGYQYMNTTIYKRL